MADLSKTVYDCQTFVIVIPIWLSVGIAFAITISLMLKLAEMYFLRRLSNKARSFLRGNSNPFSTPFSQNPRTRRTRNG